MRPPTRRLAPPLRASRCCGVKRTGCWRGQFGRCDGAGPKPKWRTGVALWAILCDSDRYRYEHSAPFGCGLCDAGKPRRPISADCVAQECARLHIRRLVKQRPQAYLPRSYILSQAADCALIHLRASDSVLKSSTCDCFPSGRVTRTWNSPSFVSTISNRAFDFEAVILPLWAGTGDRASAKFAHRNQTGPIPSTRSRVEPGWAACARKLL